MDMHVETLDLLIKGKKAKKKKEPSTKERTAFRDAWIDLVVDEGFSDRAEQFLYDGSTFCGAEPFYVYLAQAQDPTTALNAVFNGKMYGKDSNVTFRLLTHLLTLMLNGNVPQNLLIPVIMHLPDACKNKDGKRLGTAEKTMEKYFFAALSPDAPLCPLADVSTKPIFISEFVTMVASLIDGIESNGVAQGIVAVNIARVRQWISDYKATLNQPSDGRLSDAPSAGAYPEITNAKAETKLSKVVESSKPAASAEEMPENLGSYLASLLEKAKKAAEEIRQENDQQKRKTEAITLTFEDEKKKLSRAKQQIAELQEAVISLRQKLSAAENDAAALRQIVATKDAIIIEKDTEIAERIKITEVLSRDRTKQSDETLHRMASKIRIEYRDFQDAVDVPMSCDLGENLRLQLQSIFDILEKGGMNIK